MHSKQIDLVHALFNEPGKNGIEGHKVSV